MKYFKQAGWVYVPINPAGYIVSLIIAAAFINDFLFANRNAHSVSDLYYQFAPYGFMYLASWLWIASKTSKN